MGYPENELNRIRERAREIRRDSIYMIHKAGAGHPGGSLSAADLLAALYFRELRIDPQHPQWPDRDRFILSKGHCCPALYAALCARGYFGREQLDTLREYHSMLQGHPDMRKTPGLDMSSGSLGNGLSCGLGMAMAARCLKKDFRVYVLLGDGECEEGEVWEAAMAAAHHRMSQLTAIVDINGLQLTGPTCEVMNLGDLNAKVRAFGWSAIEIDGHCIEEILHAFDYARETEGPVAILAHTIKGKGVSFMENQVDWHGKAPNEEETRRALAEIMQA